MPTPQVFVCGPNRFPHRPPVRTRHDAVAGPNWNTLYVPVYLLCPVDGSTKLKGIMPMLWE
jgi:hypothetical protein